MALPKWITPAGQLGIVPELDYYEFPLDAYDASNGTLVYTLVSGRLPLGLQILNVGKIQGIPVSELGGDTNVEYKFTIRVQNTTTGGLSDRTFNITVTNVAPPIITPKNTYLGLYLDGSTVNLQLSAIEYTPGADLLWSVTAGELPPGLSLNTTGLLSGYIEPIPEPGPGSTPGWDLTAWSLQSWDFFPRAISKTFNFTVEVFDGVNYDTSTYRLQVFPRSSLTADNNTLTVDTNTVESTLDLTVDSGAKHDPIIITTQDNLVPVRQGSYFSFNVDAIDLDGDVLEYSLPVLASGAFDEQDFTSVPSLTYIAAQAPSNVLSDGAFPLTSVADTAATMQLFAGNIITASIGSFITQASTGANATITANIVNSVSIPLNITSSNFTTTKGNLSLNGVELALTSYNSTTATWSNVGIVPSSVSTGEPNVIVDVTSPGLFPGDLVKVIGSDGLWHEATVTTSTTVQLTGNTRITASSGDTITQALGDVSATISNIGVTTGNITVAGALLVGSITIRGNTNVGILTANTAAITANVGDFVTQFGTAANATIRSNVILGQSVGIQLTSGVFVNNGGILQINGANIIAVPTSTIYDNRLVSANVGDFVTQGTANATVTSNVVDAISIPVRFTSGTFTTGSGNIQLNGANVSAYPSSITRFADPLTITANVGDFITQPSTGANATVVSDTDSALRVKVIFTSGNFATGSGNIQLNGANLNIYPSTVVCQTNVTADYDNPADVFYLNSIDSTGIAYINGNSTNSYPTSIISVGVTVGGLATEGTVGFDEGKFDQGVLALPPGLTIESDTGWMTGQLPVQTINEATYDFEIVVKKRDDYTYQASRLYTLTVLGDLNNRIDWITPSDLGTIQNGKVSDLFVKAISTKGKTLVYKLTPGSTQDVPQGLIVTSGGLLSGRVSFELFSLDQGDTTIDGGLTTFDNTYTFTVTASDLDQTVSADRTFTIRVVNRNITPYENLYLKALTSVEQRAQFESIIQNRSVFPQELIYRNEDPFFGIARDIKTLFIPGLAPSTLAEYAAAAETNHYTKRITFGGVKTAQALDENFNVKYEVVYLEIFDENTNELGQGPANSIDLTAQLTTPYYDDQGNSYTVAYPNSFSNMSSAMVNALGYANKGALPDWMTSRQADGRVLGFTRAVVLAYTVADASKLIAYRFTQQNYDLNAIDFTVDRYQLDNSYSDNYDVAAGAFITSTETTFDRYPRSSSVFRDVGTVDYASTIAYEEINNRSLTAIRSLGGIDGIKNIKTGDRLVFATQEFRRSQSDLGEYNQGWNDVQTIWDGDVWDYDSNTATTTDDLGWDQAGYIPGYNEHNIDPAVANERIGVWEITVDSEGIVTLTPVQAIELYDKLFVRNGFTYGGTNIYYDPVIKQGNLIPNYSIMPQQINIVSTQFDGNGTRFFDYRDNYSVPETGDKYIKFAKLGVFN